MNEEFETTNQPEENNNNNTGNNGNTGRNDNSVAKIPPTPRTSSNQNRSGFNVMLCSADFKGFTGWMTFRAILDIIAGAFACLGIITAIYGVPKIIAGVKLLNASDEIKYYMSTNDEERFKFAFFKLNRYFKLSGISVIIQLSYLLLFFIAYIVIIIFFLSQFMSLFRDIPMDRYF
jgi:hypothetical protein